MEAEWEVEGGSAFERIQAANISGYSEFQRRSTTSRSRLANMQTEAAGGCPGRPMGCLAPTFSVQMNSHFVSDLFHLLHPSSPNSHTSTEPSSTMLPHATGVVPRCSCWICGGYRARPLARNDRNTGGAIVTTFLGVLLRVACGFSLPRPPGKKSSPWRRPQPRPARTPVWVIAQPHSEEGMRMRKGTRRGTGVEG